MKTNKLGFIGGGRITRIMLKAFKNKSVKFDSIVIYDTNQDVVSKLKEQFPDITITDSIVECANQDWIILAVHPPMMVETLKNITHAIATESLVISLAPKISIDKMAEFLPTRKIIRLIPNATSYINQGYNPIAFHSSFTHEEKIEVIQIFQALGQTFEVPEHKLEGYAIVSAMLPTYFWFQWSKMEEIAEKTGLTRAEATDTVYNTIRYADDLFFKSGMSHEDVMDLIPVKPIGEKEEEINEIYDSKLLGLFEKIKP